MKGVQHYYLFGGIALKNYAFLMIQRFYLKCLLWNKYPTFNVMMMTCINSLRIGKYCLLLKIVNVYIIVVQMLMHVTA